MPGRRRFVIGSLATVGVAVPTVTAQAVRQGAAAGEPDLKTLGLNAMRMINTIQNLVAHQPGRNYLSWSELVASGEFNSAVDGWQLRPYVSLPPDSDFLGTFQAVSILKPGSRGHLTLLVDRLSGFAYRSDENGVIYIGSCVNVRTGRPSSDPLHFVGGPMVRSISGGKRIAGGAIGRTFDRIAEMFMPTLHAQTCTLTCSCCCATACGYCCCDDTPCNQCAPAACCNTGFLTCTWCCSSDDPFNCCCVRGCGG